MAPLFYLKNDGVLLPGHWTRGFNGAGSGTDYLTRLAMAKSNIFVNRNQETVYFYQYRDGAGQRLNGANRYTLTFKKAALSPVQGFWSLTMYNQEHFFNVNDLGRYSLGTKNKTLQYADDGSLTIYVQHDKPADNRVSNWLPSPADDFAMTIRCYWPDEVIQNGDWLPPVIVETNPPTADANRFVTPADFGATDTAYKVSETDLNMKRHLAKAPVNHWVHQDDVSNVKTQQVIRENQDVIYSSAVVDISKGATISCPASDVYQVIQIIDFQNYIVDVLYPRKSLTITPDKVSYGDYVYLNMRIRKLPAEQGGLEATHKLQRQATISANAARP